MSSISLCMIAGRDSSAQIDRAMGSVMNYVNEIVIVGDENFNNNLSMSRVKLFIKTLDDFSSQRNFALRQCKSEWILVLDSDEFASLELGNELEKLDDSFDAYNIKFKAQYFGKYDSDDSHVRVFKNGHGYYEGKVHEKLIIKGKTGKLKGIIFHDAWKGWKAWLDKLDKYALWAAHRDSIKEKKPYLLKTIITSFVVFIDGYIFKKMYKYGVNGFLFSFIGAVNTFRRYAYYKEMVL